jgi:hypothetical protein
LIKLYTHQCFAKYPHFQVEDLNKDNKWENINSFIPLHLWLWH